jgi:hypothetical protein
MKWDFFDFFPLSRYFLTTNDLGDIPHEVLGSDTVA